MREIEKLEEGNYYHIYNRGINGVRIFESASDYSAFISLYEQYTKDVMDTFAYCLMSNHFHSLVFVKENVVIPRDDGKGLIRLVASRQLGHLFNAYAQSFNGRYNRHGTLFEKPFKRKRVESNVDLSSVILYIHNNPRHHGFVKDLRDWPHSSFHQIVSQEADAFLKKEFVLNLFNGRENFIKQHLECNPMVGGERWRID